METFCEIDTQIVNDYDFVKRAIISCKVKSELIGAKKLIILFDEKYKSQYFLMRLNEYLNIKKYDIQSKIIKRSRTSNRRF